IYQLKHGRRSSIPNPPLRIGESEDFRSGLIRPQLRGPGDAPRLSNITSHPILS
ncbi:hypothetical protein MKW94_022504, partial [Papaver nudicaule]|nr:hypothetical protein [Papaver nudicaule]